MKAILTLRHVCCNSRDKIWELDAESLYEKMLANTNALTATRKRQREDYHVSRDELTDTVSIRILVMV
jgi:hypothetical protein